MDIEAQTKRLSSKKSSTSTGKAVRRSTSITKKSNEYDSSDGEDDGSSLDTSSNASSSSHDSSSPSASKNKKNLSPSIGNGNGEPVDDDNSFSCWGWFKKLAFFSSFIIIALNIWAYQRLRQKFSQDLEEDTKFFDSVYTIPGTPGNPQTSKMSGDVVAESDSFISSDAGKNSNRVLKIMQLLEKIEKELHPPSEDKRRVVLLGKSFVMKRDAEIWDFTFGEAKFKVSQTTKQQMQHDRDEDWSVMLCLDLFDGKSHCIEPADLPLMKRWQRISRLYGLRKILWNKDKFCETMNSAIKGFDGGNNTREFVFPCWTLPHDYDQMIADVKDRYSKKQFILKPTDRGEGNGIIVMDSFRKLPNWKAEFPDNDEVIVQTYLDNPFLINGRKWDMRTYVLVTSIHPLRVYMYRNGLVRFASSRYDADAKDGGKKTAYLTNTSINKKTGAAVDDLTWPYYQVWAYLKQIGIDPAVLWERIENAVVRVLLASEPAFLRRFKALRNDFMCSNCYQLLGVDVIVDGDLSPRIIEVNGEPSMELSGEKGSHYDHTKKSMTHDLVQLIYNPESYARALTADLYELELDGFKIGYQALGTGCSSSDEVCLKTPELEYLVEMKKEECNQGGFRRMYPHPKGNEFYAAYVKHLESKLPYGHTTSTHTIHKLVTELAKRSRIIQKNNVDQDTMAGTGGSAHGSGGSSDPEPDEED